MEASYRIGDIVAFATPEGDNEEDASDSPLVILAKADNEFDCIVSSCMGEGNGVDSGRYTVVLTTEDLAVGSLSEKTLIHVDQIFTISSLVFNEKPMGRLNAEKIEEMLRKWSYLHTRAYYSAIHQPKTEGEFVPGQSRINYAGRVFDGEDMVHLVDSALDFWLTTGRFADRFEAELAKYLGLRYCSLVNSGSSANLLALMTLTSPQLGDKMVRRGDEIITVAASFPTTVSPIVQYGAVPVFVDVTLPTYNIDCTQLESALSDRTRAVMIAHTLGNPFDLQKVKTFCDQHGLWLVEDNCDALGARYHLDGKWQMTGTIGDLGTSSFYPPHHMTMGEGGAVYTRNPKLKRLVESFRDWGRDCWCQSGYDNTCNKRFNQQFGELPLGYDHKYVYSHFGYNLKATDMQAAIGCAQLLKLPDFIAARNLNWQKLRQGVADLSEWFVLPEATENSVSSWFGFLLTVRPEGGLTRQKVVDHLESKGIQTRMLFAGNLLKHPCFDEMRQTGQGFRSVGDLAVTEQIMRDTFWLGLYPGMKEGMIDFMVDTLKQVVKLS